jgi:protoporphyrinogen oxidase
VILVAGAGAAGLAAAWYAARAGHEVTVVDRADTVGGMAASRTVAGLRVDHGSHRLHPAADPSILADLRRLLGDDLQVRPRHGRIRLVGRWVGFPLRTGDLVRNLPPRFAAGAAFDAVTSPLRRPRADTFAEVLRAGLGPTITDGFYGPYARKLWDADPSELAGDLARRRVSASSPIDLVRRLVRGARPEGRTFLYPRRGFGQIVEAVADATVAAGATIRLGRGAGVASVDLCDADRVRVRLDDGTDLDAAALVSTLPLAALARTAGGPSVELRHRALVLAYLVLYRAPWSPFDAHYLPDPANPVARLSEPRNYRDSSADPAGTTVLCAEVPCWPGDETWEAAPDELGARLVAALAADGLPPIEPVAVEVVRLPAVYPIYRPGADWDLARAESWLATTPAGAAGRVVTAGRPGLFVPDNTHHVLAMGRAAADSLGPDGTLDMARWQAARASFRAHVVED